MRGTLALYMVACPGIQHTDSCPGGARGSENTRRVEHDGAACPGRMLLGLQAKDAPRPESSLVTSAIRAASRLENQPATPARSGTAGRLGSPVSTPIPTPAQTQARRR